MNPFTLGQLLYLFQVQTAVAGELLGIDAFDQPGVEEGKNATYALFGRPGYEEKTCRAGISQGQERQIYIISLDEKSDPTMDRFFMLDSYNSLRLHCPPKLL